MLLRTVFSLLCLVVPALGWVPLTPWMTFQWQLQGTVDTTVNADVFDVDLFDASTSVINTLKSNGKVVICYFSAGSYENWRSDVSGVPSSALGNPLDGWAGEKWWDIRVTAVRDVIISRLNEAQNKGCDAVEPDNVDGYQNSNGLGLSQADQLDFNKWMAVEARKRCLSVGLKNAVDLLNDLEPYFDWALNEECLDYNECSGYSVFLNHNKAVFHVEYVDNQSQGPAKQTAVCNNANRPSGFTTLIKTWDLYAWRLTC